MTGSWPIDAFIIGSIIIILVPLGVWIYKEIYKSKGSVTK